MQRWISRSPRLHDVIMASKKNPAELTRNLYVTILSRYPTPEESAIAEQYLKTNGQKLGPAANDVAWALVNSKEFLFRH